MNSAHSWPSRYVGKPWVDRGRSENGFDCWGLIHVALKRECAIDVPSYGEISASDLMRVTATIKEKSNCDPWIEVKRDDLQEFDVALMRGRPLHVGLIAPKLMLLHVEEKTDAVLVPLSHSSISFRLLGFRRHRDLMHAT